MGAGRVDAARMLIDARAMPAHPGPNGRTPIAHLLSLIYTLSEDLALMQALNVLAASECSAHEATERSALAASEATLGAPATTEDVSGEAADGGGDQDASTSHNNRTKCSRVGSGADPESKS